MKLVSHNLTFLQIILILSLGIWTNFNDAAHADSSVDKEITVEQQAIAALEFLVGYWGGPGISYDANNQQVEYYDTEHVRFDLDQQILLINATGWRDNAKTYQLHTVIRYDEEADHYWYQPFSSKSARQYKCHLKEQQFLCMNIEGTFRLTFQRLKDGRWNEFGERLVNGAWRKTFETKLLPVP